MGGSRTSSGTALSWGGVILSLAVLAGPSGISPQSHAVSELRGVPTGITLPVQIGRTLRAGKTKQGTVFFIETTQRVPVAADAYLNRGVRVRGEVVTSAAGDGTSSHPSVLTVRFTELEYRGRTVAVVTRAIAMANIRAVGDTFLPTGAIDKGNSNQANWTTRQVGGDEVCRSGWVGDVDDTTMKKVGFADFYGVYSLPVRLDDQHSGSIPRAMGVFSTTAEGLYGYEHGATLDSSAGSITITSPEKHVVIRNGDNLLLEVVASQ
jgi:hypothetical protein